MEWKEIAAQWKASRPSMKEQWSKVGDAQLDAIDGNRAGLIAAIRQAYAISQEQAEKQVTAWAKRMQGSRG